MMLLKWTFSCRLQARFLIQKRDAQYGYGHSSILAPGYGSVINQQYGYGSHSTNYGKK
jgi:hypothetical protein